MAAPVQLPFQRSHPMQVAPELRQLQAKGVIHRVRTPLGDPAWLVTGYAAVLALLDDPRLGLSHPQPDKAARVTRSGLFAAPVLNFATEHADHSRRRALLQPHFAPRHLPVLCARVDALTSRLLDELAATGPPADVQALVALPLPIVVICELLGVPYEDRDRFRAWTTAAGDHLDSAHAEEGLRQLLAYGKELVAAKRRQPGDDVVSRLCATEGVSDGEAADLSMTLLWAGHATTVSQIGLGILALLANPEQWRALTGDPGLTAHAVEETLRASRRGSGTIPRYARTELHVDGVTINAGDLVLLGIAAANHDPAVFHEPDQVDITRPPVRHLTFGYGVRYCLGAPLARLELNAVFSQLASRFPTMRLAIDVQQITLRTDTMFGGLTELPVRW